MSNSVPMEGDECISLNIRLKCMIEMYCPAVKIYGIVKTIVNHGAHLSPVVFCFYDTDNQDQVITY